MDSTTHAANARRRIARRRARRLRRDISPAAQQTVELTAHTFRPSLVLSDRVATIVSRLLLSLAELAFGSSGPVARRAATGANVIVAVSASAGTSATKANERTDTVNGAVRTRLLKFWEGASVSTCAPKACPRLFSAVCLERVSCARRTLSNFVPVQALEHGAQARVAIGRCAARADLGEGQPGASHFVLGGHAGRA
jgi:hypothetical protein